MKQKRTEVNDAIVAYSYSGRGHLMISLEDGKSFIIDTGSEVSYIFSDRLHVKPSILRLYSINPKEKRIFCFRKLDSLQIGNLLIKNHDFIFKKSKNTLHKNDTTIAGLIGMDILSQKYCYFDVKNQTITFSDKKKTQTETPFFVFSYKSAIRPLSDLCIEGTMFEDVLFDTGFNDFLTLFEEDRKKLNVSMLPLRKDTSCDFYGNQSIIYFYELDSVKINGVHFTNPTISYGLKYRLLGMKFVRCWSSFSIDPFKKEIAFYL